MRRALLFAVGAIALALVVPVTADESMTYTIKLKKDASGDKTKVTSNDEGETTFALDVMGQNLNKSETKVTKHAYTEDLVEKPAGSKKATKLNRKYEKSETTKDGKKNTHGYEGKTVTIEKKGDKYTFRADGVLLEGDDIEDLEQEFRKDEIPLENEDLLPNKPVKINEVWIVDVDKVVKSFESGVPFGLDPDRTKVTGKLTKAYEKDGKPYGTIEVTMILAVKLLKVDGQEIPMKAGSKISVTSILDVCIDGSSHSGTEKTTMKMDMTGDIPNGKMSIKGDVKTNKTVEDLKVK